MRCAAALHARVWETELASVMSEHLQELQFRGYTPCKEEHRMALPSQRALACGSKGEAKDQIK